MSLYVATVETDRDAGLSRWRAWIEAGAATSLFQTPEWLAAWYATLGAQPGRLPLLASVARADGQVLLALPLSLERRGGLRRIGFADLGVADYAAPLLMPGCPADAASARAMVDSLRRALPPADLLAIEKLPETVQGLANPLLRLGGVRGSSLCGHPVTIGEDFDAWRYSREKTHRKELERSWRVFTRHPEASFRLVGDVAEAMRVMDALEAYQREAIAHKGWAYVLDEPGYRDFYRRLIVEGLAAGTTVLSVLSAGEEVVGALLGLRRGAHYAMIRIGSAGGEWRNCSPGRLVIERTMHTLHAQGVRHFDFTIGDYAYKRGFMPEQLALFDLALPLSWRGAAWASCLRLKHGTKRWLAARPALKRRLVEARGALARAGGG